MAENTKKAKGKKAKKARKGIKAKKAKQVKKGYRVKVVFSACIAWSKGYRSTGWIRTHATLGETQNCTLSKTWCFDHLAILHLLFKGKKIIIIAESSNANKSLIKLTFLT